MLEKLFGAKHNEEAVSAEVDRLSTALDRYDRIFKGSRGYGFIDWEVNEGQTHWHGGFWSYLGYGDDVISKLSRSEEYLSFIHPEDKDRFEQNIIRLFKQEPRDDLIFRVRRADGEYIWVEMRVEAVRRVDGWVSHLSGVVFDVSTLKETEQALKVSEARHARIIQAANDGIWEWSVEHGGKSMQKTTDDGWDWGYQKGGFTFSSRCWEMIGYSVDDEEVNDGILAWRRMMHKDDGKRFDKALSDHIFKKAPFEVEYRIRGKDGEWHWILGRGQMLYNKQGHPSVMSGTNIDITALKRAEERVFKAKEEAEKASQAKSEFLSSMSHELRTPLNAILGFAQLLEMDKGLSSEHINNAHEIKSAGNHLLELVGDVLDLAKIEAGHLNLSVEKVLPSRVINECATLLKSQIERAELSLEIIFNDLEHQIILADPVRLKQVILNLMGNATKYNRKGGVIRVECSMSIDKRMKILVEDSGQGIPESLQAELFQPFNRLGAERSGVEGTGVGLVITKQLVQQMGGEIGFSSEEKVGSRFWVEFSAVSDGTGEQQAIEGKASSCAVEGELPELSIKGHKKILYVEDNPSNQKLMQQVLAKFPELELTVVGLAVQGLYVARSEQPDLVILDVNLPGIDGYEVVDILKQDPVTKHLPVIALSANVLSHDIQKGKESGFDHYLTKPLNIAEFIDTCNKLLGE